MDSLNQCPFLLLLHLPSLCLSPPLVLSHHLLRLYLLVLQHLPLFYMLGLLIVFLLRGISLDIDLITDVAQDRCYKFLQIIGSLLQLRSLRLLHLMFIFVRNHQIIIRYQLFFYLFNSCCQLKAIAHLHLLNHNQHFHLFLFSNSYEALSLKIYLWINFLEIARSHSHQSLRDLLLFLFSIVKVTLLWSISQMDWHLFCDQA